VPEVISMFVEVLVSGKGRITALWRRDKSFAPVMVHGFEIWALLF